jgi:hypothetical protein
MFLDKCSETNDEFRHSRSRMGLGYVVFAAEAQSVSPGSKARDCLWVFLQDLKHK